MAQTKVFDLHCDTIDALAMRDCMPFAGGRGAIQGDMASNNLQLALDRMQAVGPWCQCYAVWVPDDLSGLPTPDPLWFYRRARDYFFAQVKEHAELHLLLSMRACSQRERRPRCSPWKTALPWAATSPSWTSGPLTA